MIGTPRTRALAGLGVLGSVVALVVLTDGSDDEVPTVGAAPSTTVAPGAPATSAEPVGSDAPDVTSTVPAATEPVVDDAPDLPDRGLHPELRDIEGWLQSEVTSLEELRGKVVAVQFWTFGCSNCKATLPHMQALYEAYGAEGFEIVGIHAPEFDYEADVDNIVEAAADLGVTWPIALDTKKRTFHSWQEGPRGYWPRIYLLDRDGHIRYDNRGEGRYDQIDAAVRALLAEPA